MERNPPADADHSAGGPSPPPTAGGAAAPAEILGPLAVRRMAKDDGRSLLVYERILPRREAAGETPGRVPQA
jgi:hypothetical protein